MRRSVKFLALVLVLVMAVTAFAGCAKRLSGIYEATVEGNIVTLSFDGKDFIYKNGSVELRGTYDIQSVGEKYFITMTCDESAVNGQVTKLEEPENVYDEAEIRIHEDYISIGNGATMTKYTKK